MYGINALSSSLAFMLNRSINDINAELRKLLEHPEYEEMCKIAGYTNKKIYVDQLAMLVMLFGCAHGMKDTVLGFILADSWCYMYPGLVSEESRWVWISSSSMTGVNSPYSTKFPLRMTLPSTFQVRYDFLPLKQAPPISNF
jgi:hypothetical protein